MTPPPSSPPLIPGKIYQSKYDFGIRPGTSSQNYTYTLIEEPMTVVKAGTPFIVLDAFIEAHPYEITDNINKGTRTVIHNKHIVKILTSEAVIGCCSLTNTSIFIPQ